MTSPLILASKSGIRRKILESVKLDFTSENAKIDETMIKESMEDQGSSHQDIAIALAEMKARKVSLKNPHARVLGCDQVLRFKGGILSKPETPADALEQLKQLRGSTHFLISAMVMYQNGQRIWHHHDQAELTMTNFSDRYLNGYIDRNWDSIRFSVGGYKIEEEGLRLFSAINGNHFTILGLPLLPLLAYLRSRGDIET